MFGNIDTHPCRKCIFPCIIAGNRKIMGITMIARYLFVSLQSIDRMHKVLNRKKYHENKRVAFYWMCYGGCGGYSRHSD